MKRILYSSVFVLLLTALLCRPFDLFALTKTETSFKQQDSKTGFIENKGQIVDLKYNPNPAVLYLLNTPGFNVQLRASGWSYDVYQFTSPPTPLLKERGDSATRSSLLLQEKGLRDEVHKPYAIKFHRIDISLVASNPACQIIPSDPLPDYFNYFTAGTPPEGIKNVQQFSKITYKDIYPDIDLEFFTNPEHGYKYNFVIHQGGNIQNIRLKIDGPDSILFNRDNLKFSIRFGDVEEVIPLSYYISNDSKVDIKVRFRKLDTDVFGFAVDKSFPLNSLLVIDPTLIRLWGTYYGGYGWDSEAQCAVDKDGNVFLAGGTESPNNIASTGSYQDTLGSTDDCFLAKFNAAGQRQWGTYFGGSGVEELGWATCIVDGTGNIYISGDTYSTSGIASPGAHQTVFGGGSRDCFVVKFNTLGNRLWGTYYGGDHSDCCGVVSVDKNENVFLAGQSSSDTGISTSGSYQPLRNTTSGCAFLAKFDSNGVRQWGTYYGGELGAMGQGCATDNSGNIYFDGETSSHTNIASLGAYQTTYGGDPIDAFLAKFTTNGQRIWATYYGGTGEDSPKGCTTDSLENLLMVGRTTSPDGIASSGAHQTIYSGGPSDAFIVKFDSSGQRLWGTYYGGTNYDDAIGCTVGWNNTIFITGTSYSSNRISTPNAYQSAQGGSGDGYLAKFNANGQRQWGTYYGGIAYDMFWKCNYVHDDTIYVSGCTYSTDTIASQGSWQPVSGGDRDDMLIKFLDCWTIDTAGPIVGPLNVCKPSNGINYSIPALAHAINYIWTLPTGFTITSGSGTKNIIVDIGISAVSGNIWVKGLNKCGDAGDSAFQVISINLTPSPVINGPSNTCAGTGKIYTTAFGKTNYQWSVSPGGVITSGGGPTDNTVTVSWLVVGTQHVYVNYTDGGCSAVSATDYPVTVTASPVVSVTINATPSNTVCSGAQVNLTATPTNGGGLPSYQWKVNGANVGTGTSTYSYVPLNNDIVTCILTSSITGCIMNNPDTSNAIVMTVDPGLPVSITLTSSPPTICAGSSVTFTAHPTNGGATPSYSWKVNGIGVGTNSDTYSFIPVNGDLVSCTLNSSETCTTNNPASSIQYPVSVSPLLAVSISISASPAQSCPGQTVTFTATPIHGGTTPSYQWFVNSNPVGTNSDTFSYIPLNGDLVSCTLNSSESCTTNNPVSSLMYPVSVSLGVPVSIMITASANPFCPGSPVTFTATPTNGGTAPTYQWKVNGVNVGINSNTYSYNPLNGDSIRCIINSNLSCVTGNPASSAEIIMSGTLAPLVTFAACFDTITTLNAKPIKLKGGIPLNGAYSGAGVNSITGLFTPSIAGVGTKTISYSYTNSMLCTASKSIHITVQAVPVFSCGNVLNDIRDSKTYQTVQIGTQCWMAEDLNYGTEIPYKQDQRDNCIAEFYRYASRVTRNAYYQWDELMQYDATPADQGFCPPGWHIPTENDWNQLFANYTNSGLAGSPLKYSGFSGFNALLSGLRDIKSNWDLNGFVGFYWSSTAYGSGKAWAHGMNDVDPSVSNYPGLRTNAFSVRCLQD